MTNGEARRPPCRLAGTAVDFSQKHDYWDVMDQPIAALRERFGVPTE